MKAAKTETLIAYCLNSPTTQRHLSGAKNYASASLINPQFIEINNKIFFYRLIEQKKRELGHKFAHEFSTDTNF